MAVVIVPVERIPGQGPVVAGVVCTACGHQVSVCTVCEARRLGPALDRAHVRAGCQPSLLASGEFVGAVAELVASAGGRD